MSAMAEQILCFHCGDVCGSAAECHEDEKFFCCDGCRTVYTLLRDSDMCDYYSIQQHAGISPKVPNYQQRFAFLDDPSVADVLIRFRNQEYATVVFHLPQMHCSSCLWLLEHLYRIEPAVKRSRTDFMRKEVTIDFNPNELSIRKLVERLTSIGYEPLLTLDNTQKSKQIKGSRMRIYRIAVAGFCFGNIMLFSFPDYFHIEGSDSEQIQQVFKLLNVLLALPVLLFSAGEFFQAAWNGIKNRYLNIDIPLVISIVLTFGRSLYEVFTSAGSGYFDSMTGIVFFMLVGRYVQSKTESSLKFDRDLNSFFPIGVQVIRNEQEASIPLQKLVVGDQLVVRSLEMIPADAVLKSDHASIDYSFVTGESDAVIIKRGDVVYAGGKLVGSSVVMEVVREVSQGYLTGLWNRAIPNDHQDQDTQVDQVAKYFTIFLLLLSFGAFVYWFSSDMDRGFHALTTVLIVACPCALLLSATFTHGATIRAMSRRGFYLRNAHVIARMAKVSALIMDKTGTMTNPKQGVAYCGLELSHIQRRAIFSLTRESNHPVSRVINAFMNLKERVRVSNYTESVGNGISGVVDGVRYRIGKADWCGLHVSHDGYTYVAADDQVLGYFERIVTLRPALGDVWRKLMRKFQLIVMSGDSPRDEQALEEVIGGDSEMIFHCSPDSKLERVKNLQRQAHIVAMLGDGLNDAPALSQSDVGIAISDDLNNFSPASDAILDGHQFGDLPHFFSLARWSRRIVWLSFLLSLVYNTVGLSYAVQGELSPWVAAILMPISSITIILFTTGMVHVVSWKLFSTS